MALEWKFSGAVHPERSCCCFYMLKANKAPATARWHGRWTGEKDPWPFQLPFGCPCSPEPAAQDSCALSPFPALALLPQ